MFQRYLSENFQDIDGVNIYIDDLLIYADSVEKHNEILEKVLKGAEQLNLIKISSNFYYMK